MKDLWFKVGILIAIFCFAGAMAYHYVVQIPQENTDKINTENLQAYDLKQEKQDQADKLTSCLSEAIVDYNNSIESRCGTGNCEAFWQDRLNTQLNEDRNACFNQFPQN